MLYNISKQNHFLTNATTGKKKSTAKQSRFAGEPFLPESELLLPEGELLIPEGELLLPEGEPLLLEGESLLLRDELSLPNYELSLPLNIELLLKMEPFLLLIKRL